MSHRTWSYGLPAPPVTDPVALATRTARRLLRRACFDGLEPAEALTTEDREGLVRELCALGWSDLQISTHTRLSTYTTGRIRDRLGLPPNQDTRGVA